MSGTITVTISEHGIQCDQPDGESQCVSWDDLHTIVFETTEQGSFVNDFFIILEGYEGSCVIPMEAQGTDELMIELQQLPGFDNARAIAAMGAAERQRFVCWQR